MSVIGIVCVIDCVCVCVSDGPRVLDVRSDTITVCSTNGFGFYLYYMWNDRLSGRGE